MKREFNQQLFAATFSKHVALLKESILNEAIKDPTKEQMVDYLRMMYGREEGFEFDAEEAMYWFANHYHGGQSSNLYSVLSTSKFRPGAISKGPEQGSLAQMMYEELVAKFGDGEVADMDESLLDRDEDYGDGYNNDSQRAFAASQMERPRKNETNKAIQLAKSGKYVVVVSYPVHCPSTDAVLGEETVIEKVCSTKKEAEKEQAHLHGDGNHDNRYSIIGPEDVDHSTGKIKQKKYEPLTDDDNNVPFESVGGHSFKLAEASKPDKISNSERTKISAAFSKAGVDGNGRFNNASKGISAVSVALDSVGFNLDMVSGDIILGDKGNRLLPYRRKTTDSNIESPEIKNSRIAFNWEKLGDKFEIQCYAS